jgi:hypothetical protein
MMCRSLHQYIANKGQIGLEMKEGKFLPVHSIALGVIKRNYGRMQGARSIALGRTKNSTRQLHESIVIQWMCKCEC